MGLVTLGESGAVLMCNQWVVQHARLKPGWQGKQLPDVFEGGIARGAEIVAPGKRMDFGARFLGDFHRAVGRTGIHDDDLISNSLDAAKARRKKFFLVLYNHTEREFTIHYYSCPDYPADRI